MRTGRISLKNYADEYLSQTFRDRWEGLRVREATPEDEPLRFGGHHDIHLVPLEDRPDKGRDGFWWPKEAVVWDE